MNKQCLGIIYKATFENGKCYIGQTFRGLLFRKKDHIKSKGRENVAFHNAINKYGEDNIIWEIIDIADSIKELNKKEIYWINFYNSFIHSNNSRGYNMTFGGKSTSGWIPSEETRKKIGESNKGRCLTEEHKNKLSLSLSGKNNPMYGKTHSEEARKKISEFNLGRKFSEEVRKKMSCSQKKKTFTDEHRKNLSEGAFKMWEKRKNGNK